MRIGFLSDTHLDYASGSRFTSKGVNVRVQDGFDALAATIDGMLESGVDVVIHGGDLFHKSIPTVRGIIHAREQFLRLTDAGIPVYGIIGNHDWGNTVYRRAASMAIDDPRSGIRFFDSPTDRVELADGLELHLVSHAGLMPLTADPVPTDGAVNLLVTHGAAEIDGYNDLYTCEDSPSEAWVPQDVLKRPWNLTLAGHYHNRHQLPLDYPAWYAGSALRRGFSDAEGDRGWLQVDVDSSGNVTVVEKNIPQRAQYDLPEIDASALTGDEVLDLMRENLKLVDASAMPIVRQKVHNISTAVRKTVQVDVLDTENFLVWQPRFFRPEIVEGTRVKVDERSSLEDSWNDFVAAAGVLDEDREEVLARGKRLIEQAGGEN